jgi:hypothetical protein
MVVSQDYTYYMFSYIINIWPTLENVRDFLYYCSMSYVIIKTIRDEVKQVDLPVIMLDSQSEILEFETEEEAVNLAELMNANTDSGHKYSVKKIG